MLFTGNFRFSSISKEYEGDIIPGNIYFDFTKFTEEEEEGEINHMCSGGSPRIFLLTPSYRSTLCLQIK